MTGNGSYGWWWRVGLPPPEPSGVLEDFDARRTRHSSLFHGGFESWVIRKSLGLRERRELVCCGDVVRVAGNPHHSLTAAAMLSPQRIGNVVSLPPGVVLSNRVPNEQCCTHREPPF